MAEKHTLRMLFLREGEKFPYRGIYKSADKGPGFEISDIDSLFRLCVLTGEVRSGKTVRITIEVED